jgi:hypothetical protein
LAVRILRKKSFTELALNCAVALSAVVVSLGVAEWIFVSYERARFSSGYIDEHGIVNLHALNYNDTNAAAIRAFVSDTLSPKIRARAE